MTSVPASPASTPKPRPQPNILLRAFYGLMHLIDRVIDPLQQRIGVRGMAYLFVLPNLLIFGVFILFPMLLNFYYAFTGGTKLFPQDRPFVGTANLQMLFDCQDYLNPNTCSQDIFWRAVY